MSYRVLLHPTAVKDLSDIPKDKAASLLQAMKNRLSEMPEHVSVPIKGSKGLLWRFRFSVYRSIFHIKHKTSEVWVLAIEHRATVYRPEHLDSLLKLAVALHAQH